MFDATSPYEHRSPFRVALLYGRRLLALLAVAAVIGGIYVGISPLLPAEWLPWEDETSATVTPPPPRPASAPAQIPPWAWELNAWHSAPATVRGARPADAPARVPAWYWEWREWRLALAD
jgi:hypothetical protein